MWQNAWLRRQKVGSKDRAIRKRMKGMPIILANNITKARKSLA